MVRKSLGGAHRRFESMFMIAAERVSPSSPQPSQRAAGTRSPFARLRELLDHTPPGKPAISLAVGEPQHAIPSFVGPVLAAHLDEFGRYPMNKGLDGFCGAAADWLARRFPLPRPLDPTREVLVLNGRFFEAGELVSVPTRAAIQEHAIPSTLKRLSIEHSKLGLQAAPLGAGLVAIREAVRQL